VGLAGFTDLEEQLIDMLLLLLLLQSTKDFLFSEVGLGGAQPDGRSTAADLQSLAENVENGIWAVYNTAQDPWQRQVRRHVCSDY
jgi:hypothetical protein